MPSNYINTTAVIGISDISIYPFLYSNNYNFAYCKIFKEIYTYKIYENLELLYFSVNKELKLFSFQIGIKTDGKVTNIIWQFNKSYADIENCTIVCCGSESSKGYVVLDVEEIKQLNTTWTNYDDPNVYKLDYKKIADIDFCPQIKLYMINRACRFIDNIPLDNNIVEFYIEGDNANQKRFHLSSETDKSSNTQINSYISNTELHFTIFDSDGNRYIIYAKRQNEDLYEPKFTYCCRSITNKNNETFIFHIIFKYGWTPAIADNGECVMILPSAFDLSLNPYISSIINKNEAISSAQENIDEMKSYINNRIAHIESDINYKEDYIINKINDISLTIPNESITSDMLNSELKTLINTKGDITITNNPDNYFLTNINNQITIADRTIKPFRQGVVVVRKGFLSSSDIQENTIYLIADNIDLKDNILELKQGTSLKLIGGSISNGTIRGYGSIIDAPEYRIFHDNVKLDGNFANAFPIEWWGASSCNEDSSPYINAAIQSGAMNLVAHGKEYYIDSTILLNKSDISLCFDGNVIARNGITAFNVYYDNITLKIHKLISATSAKTATDNSGVLISDNCYHSTFNIHSILYFGKGLNLCPRKHTDTYAGIQYCKFTFHEFINVENIVFDLNSNDIEKPDIWINENQFFGGRVGGNINGTYCNYGIRHYGNRNADYDPVNGNVFYCIGFEAVKNPIYLYNWENDQFHDLRMSESIINKIYINLHNCKHLNFSIKSSIHKGINNGIPTEIFIEAIDCKNVIVKDSEYTYTINNGKITAHNLFKFLDESLDKLIVSLK